MRMVHPDLLPLLLKTCADSCSTEQVIGWNSALPAEPVLLLDVRWAHPSSLDINFWATPVCLFFPVYLLRYCINALSWASSGAVNTADIYCIFQYSSLTTVSCNLKTYLHQINLHYFNFVLPSVILFEYFISNSSLYVCCCIYHRAHFSELSFWYLCLIYQIWFLN